MSNIYDRLYDVRNYTGMYAERFRDLSQKLSAEGTPGKADFTGSTNQNTDMKFDSVADFLRPTFRSRTRISDTVKGDDKKTTWSPRGMDPIAIPDHPLDTPGKLQYLFKFYCMYGRTGLQRIETLGEFQYMRFIRHCPGLLEDGEGTRADPYRRLLRKDGGGELLDQTEADLIFVRAKGRCKNRLTFDTWMDCLQMMAVKKYPMDNAKTALTYLLANHVLRNENLVKIGQGADSVLDAEQSYAIADAPPTHDARGGKRGGGARSRLADAAPALPTTVAEAEEALEHEKRRLIDEIFGEREGLDKYSEIVSHPEAFVKDQRPYVQRILKLWNLQLGFEEVEREREAAASGENMVKIMEQSHRREEAQRLQLDQTQQDLKQSEQQRELLAKQISLSRQEQERAENERRALSHQLEETRAMLASMQLAMQSSGQLPVPVPPAAAAAAPAKNPSPARVHIDRTGTVTISPVRSSTSSGGAAAAATPLPQPSRITPRGAPAAIRNVRTIAGNGNFIFCLGALQSTGGFLAGSGDNIIYERRAGGDLATRPTLKGHASEVYCILVLADGSVVSGSSDSTICHWTRSARGGAWTMTEQLLKHRKAVFCLTSLQGKSGAVVAGAKRSWLSDSCRCAFASGGEDGLVHLWQKSAATISRERASMVAGGFNVVESLSGHEGCVYSLTTLHDGTLVSGGQDHTIVMWREGRCVRILTEHTKEVYCLVTLNAVSFASGSGDMTICTWNNDGILLNRLADHIGPVLALVTMPGGNFASGSSDKVIRVWEDSGNCVAALKGHTDPVSCLACLADGTLISGSDDKTIRLWRS